MAAFGSTPGIIVGVGVGAAASAAIEPAVEVAKQDAWSRLPNRILDVGIIARLVARGGIVLGAPDGSQGGTAYNEALREGFTGDKLARLIYLEQTVPGFAEALRLWRLGFISDEAWTHTLVKAGMDARYMEPLDRLKGAELLGLGDLAYAVVRGIVPAPSWVPVAPPTEGDKVKRFPVVDLDPIAEAAKLGFSEELFQIMVGRSGLSMAPGMAANALFRGLIGDRDYLLAIAEGDLRTEWADAVRDVSREILTSHDAAELELRGFFTRDERLAKTERHGMADDDSDSLYDLLGRSIPVHQITTGEARGGVFEGPADTIPAAYLQSLQRGNLRPEYYNLAYANRYSYPSAFFIRLLLQNGDITGAEAEQIFLEIGWSPKLAKLVADALAVTKTAGADPHVAKAESQLWTTLHRSYVGQMSGTTEARSRLDALGVPAAGQDQVLRLWDAERSLVRRQLSPAQVKKAVAEKVTNPATGSAWTDLEALAALQDRGYSPDDARTFLAE